MPLEGKVVILTGGAGGIGKKIAAKLLRQRGRLVIADVEKGSLELAVRDLASFGEIEGHVLDVSNAGEVLSFENRVVARHGTADVLINAAGIQAPIGAFWENDIGEWARNIQVNLMGTVICCRAFAPVFMGKKAGKIVNFAGGGANAPRPRFSAYGTAKAGVVRFTETLAEELRSFGVQVNAVSPGVIRTRMIEETLEAGFEKAGPEYNQLRARETTGFDDPENVADLVGWLASDASNGLTGRIISAVWDPWRTWTDGAAGELDKDLYVLRRIDARNFKKA